MRRIEKLVTIFITVMAIVFIAPWLGVKIYRNYAIGIERKWEKYFYSPEVANNTSIVELKFKKKNGKSVFELDNSALERLYKKPFAWQKILGSELDFQDSIISYQDYSCIFSDGEQLDSVAIFYLFQDRIYLALFYPGYPDDPCVHILLNGILTDKVLNEIREWIIGEEN